MRIAIDSCFDFLHLTDFLQTTFSSFQAEESCASHACARTLPVQHANAFVKKYMWVFFHRMESKSRYVCVIWKAVCFKLKGDIGLAIYCLFSKNKIYSGSGVCIIMMITPLRLPKARQGTNCNCVTLKLLDQNICMHIYFNFIIVCYLYKGVWAMLFLQNMPICMIMIIEFKCDGSFSWHNGSCFCTSYTLSGLK